MGLLIICSPQPNNYGYLWICATSHSLAYIGCSNWGRYRLYPHKNGSVSLFWLPGTWILLGMCYVLLVLLLSFGMLGCCTLPLYRCRGGTMRQVQWGENKVFISPVPSNHIISGFQLSKLVVIWDLKQQVCIADNRACMAILGVHARSL